MPIAPAYDREDVVGDPEREECHQGLFCRAGEGAERYALVRRKARVDLGADYGR